MGGGSKKAFGPNLFVAVVRANCDPVDENVVESMGVSHVEAKGWPGPAIREFRDLVPPGCGAAEFHSQWRRFRSLKSFASEAPGVKSRSTGPRASGCAAVAGRRSASSAHSLKRASLSAREDLPLAVLARSQ
eukprot:CAMPEP_0115177632 /NCGR_PEP_ID=MMETSP0270-20121206/5480_1 /TAXON_ID=71861 /ORGANISM="Scrippsiella trochoidea, Strain CCMP3099" /LENGTH=131 /DNA_ID=CAMNT_0002590559 /DNA_START=9 /DNA_END=404 /DNA_ORIENTATION=-